MFDMKELYRSPNPVELSVLQQLLSNHDIETVILDQHSGSLFQGMMGIGARLMVVNDDLFGRAQEIAKSEGFSTR